MAKNKTPEDHLEAELVLAKMLQSANARGLKPHKGTFYRSSDGRNTYYVRKSTVACCAVGAYYLDENDEPPDFEGSIVCGNDANPEDEDLFNGLGFDIGHSFQEALK